MRKLSLDFYNVSGYCTRNTFVYGPGFALAFRSLAVKSLAPRNRCATGGVTVRGVIRGSKAIRPMLLVEIIQDPASGTAPLTGRRMGHAEVCSGVVSGAAS